MSIKDYDDFYKLAEADLQVGVEVKLLGAYQKADGFTGNFIINPKGTPYVYGLTHVELHNGNIAILQWEKPSVTEAESVGDEASETSMYDNERDRLVDESLK